MAFRRLEAEPLPPWAHAQWLQTDPQQCAVAGLQPPTDTPVCQAQVQAQGPSEGVWLGEARLALSTPHISVGAPACLAAVLPRPQQHINKTR